MCREVTAFIDADAAIAQSIADAAVRVLDQNTTDAPRKKKDNASHTTHVMDRALDLLSTFSDAPSESAKKFDAAVKIQKTWRAMRARVVSVIWGGSSRFSLYLLHSRLPAAPAVGGGQWGRRRKPQTVCALVDSSAASTSCESASATGATRSCSSSARRARRTSASSSSTWRALFLFGCMCVHRAAGPAYHR